MPATATPYSFTLGDYERMVEAGLFDGVRVELIDGEIIHMPPLSTDHVGGVNRLSTLIQYRIFQTYAEPHPYVVSVQNAVRLSPRDAPEPDLALVRRDAGLSGTIRAGHVLLIVEVSISTLAFDLDRKLPRYAAAGVPEVWIVDVRGARVLAHRRPEAGAYAERAAHGPGDAIGLVAISELGTFAVDEILASAP